MKKAFLIIIIGVFAVGATHAQSRKAEQSKAWKQFQNAIAKNDKSAVAAMLKYPFEASIINFDSEYTMATKADFIKLGVTQLEEMNKADSTNIRVLPPE